MRSAHSEVGYVCGTFRQKLFVCGLNMRMCSENRRNFAVKIKPECAFFTRRFRMYVNQNVVCVDFFQQSVNGRERVIDVFNVYLSQKIYHGNRAERGFYFRITRAGCRRRKIRGTDYVIFFVKQGIDAFLFEDVVTRRYNVRAAKMQFPCVIGGNSVVLVRVLAVDNDKIRTLFIYQTGQNFFDSIKSDVRNNVAETDKFHIFSPFWYSNKFYLIIITRFSTKSNRRK